MASLRFENDRGRKGWRLRFRDKEKRQRVIWLGEVAEHFAKETKAHVEHLVAMTKRGLPSDSTTVDWLTRQNTDLRNKLAKVGLCDSVESLRSREISLVEWIDTYISERSDVSPNTRKTYGKAKANLLDYFGEKKKIREITKADAKRWRIWLATQTNKRDKNRNSIADATVRRRTGKAKQFFKEAAERGYVDHNPFDGLPSTVNANEATQFFVPVEWIEKCMDHCPSIEWKTILALARYGGLRCPSELAVLRWKDVNLPEGRMMIDSPKTGLRVCPIFAELRPYLEAAWDAAPEGAEFVLPGIRATTNLRTRFTTIIKAAGLVPWPKLLQNLRASRETELMAKYPAKDVSSWIGNSVVVAMKHYAMATENNFQDAAGMTGGHIGGHIRGHIMGNAGNLTSNPTEATNAKNPGETEVLRSDDDSRESAESSISGRNRSRICDLLHVKQAL